jgi:hypothetical protein
MAPARQTPTAALGAFTIRLLFRHCVHTRTRFGVRLAEGDNGTLWWSEGDEDGGADAATDEQNPA